MDQTRTTRDWRHIAVVSGCAVAMGLAGGYVAQSEVSIVIVAIGGLAAGSIMFLANLMLERIYPQC